MPCFDLPLSQRTVSSQSSFELMWKKWSPYSTASSSSRIYIYHLYMAHTSVSTTVVYRSQNFPLTSLPISQYIVNKMRRMEPFNCVSISIHHQAMTGWCTMKWNVCGRKWSWPVWSTTATFAWRDKEKPMKIYGQDSHQVLPYKPIPSVDLYNIIHHCYQNKCLIHIPVYLSMSIH